MVHRQSFFTKIASRCLGASTRIIWGITELFALQRLRYRAWRTHAE